MTDVNMRAYEILAKQFSSPNVPDDNGGPANLVDTTQRIAEYICDVASATGELSRVHDKALNRIADAIFELVDVVKSQ